MHNYKPDGFVGLPLTKKQVEVYLHLLHETMNVAQMFTAQLRAIEIIAANEVKEDEKKVA